MATRVLHGYPHGMLRHALPYLIRAGLCGTLVAMGSAQCTFPDLTSETTPGNFHVVDDGRTYRCAQPSGDQLAAVIDTYGIRTVLNLRGVNVGKDWYDAEAAVCSQKGITLANFSMSANGLPPPALLKGVVNTLKTADFPVLIHCNGGADRSGLVSAIYDMLILGQDRSDALGQLSPEFLHFRAFTPCMDTVAELFEPTDAWLEWYANNYDSIECK